MTKEHAIDWIRKSVNKDSRLWKAIESLVPELRKSESENERMRKCLISYLKGEEDECEYNIPEMIVYLEKQKEQTEELSTRLNGLMQEYVKSGKDEEEQEHRLKCYQLFWDALSDSEFFEQREHKPILEVFGFKVGDAVRLKDGDGRKHIIKSFEEVEGVHGPNFYHVEFEDDSARDGIYPGEEYPKGYYTQMEKFEEEQKSAEYLDKDMVYAIMKKLHKLAYSQLIPINSDEYKEIDEITGDVRRLLDYPIEQKPVWSEKEKKIIKNIRNLIFNYAFTNGGVNVDGDYCKDVYQEADDFLKSLRPQPHKEIYQAAKHDLAIKFMNYLDENRSKGKMCLSNIECEDIDKAFNENDWTKIVKYVEKFKPH